MKVKCLARETLVAILNTDSMNYKITDRKSDSLEICE